jgi:hypothetical protein
LVAAPLVEVSTSVEESAAIRIDEQDPEPPKPKRTKKRGGFLPPTFDTSKLKPPPPLGALPGFDELPAATRALLETLAARNPNARFDLGRLVQSAGFAALSPNEQAQLAELIGTRLPRGTSMRLLLGLALSDTDPVEVQAKKLRAFLEDQPGLPHFGIPANPQFAQAEVKVTGPTALTEGDLAGMDRYDLEVDGRTVFVYLPRDADLPEGKRLPTIQEIADAVASLPKHARDQLSVIEGDPKESGAYAAAAAFGQVDLHPHDGSPASIRLLKYALVHELGHVWSRKKFGLSKTDKGWDRWKRAMDRDRLDPSKYGQRDAAEDFAEAYAVYLLVRGTPAEADYRRLMPERFAVLDELVG